MLADCISALTSDTSRLGTQSTQIRNWTTEWKIPGYVQLSSILLKYETQTNLTVASLLGGLWWVSYFSFDTFLKMITLPSKVKNDDVILRSPYADDVILRRALDDDVTFRRALDYDVTFRCALDDVVTFR